MCRCAYSSIRSQAVDSLSNCRFSLELPVLLEAASTKAKLGCNRAWQTCTFSDFALRTQHTSNRQEGRTVEPTSPSKNFGFRVVSFYPLFILLSISFYLCQPLPDHTVNRFSDRRMYIAQSGDCKQSACNGRSISNPLSECPPPSSGPSIGEPVLIPDSGAVA